MGPDWQTDRQTHIQLIWAGPSLERSRGIKKIYTNTIIHLMKWHKNPNQVTKKIYQLSTRNTGQMSSKDTCTSPWTFIRNFYASFFFPGAINLLTRYCPKFSSCWHGKLWQFKLMTFYKKITYSIGNQSRHSFLTSETSEGQRKRSCTSCWIDAGETICSIPDWSPLSMGQMTVTVSDATAVVIV